MRFLGTPHERGYTKGRSPPQITSPINGLIILQSWPPLCTQYFLHEGRTLSCLPGKGESSRKKTREVRWSALPTLIWWRICLGNLRKGAVRERDQHGESNARSGGLWLWLWGAQAPGKIRNEREDESTRAAEEKQIKIRLFLVLQRIKFSEKYCPKAHFLREKRQCLFGVWIKICKWIENYHPSYGKENIEFILLDKHELFPWYQEYQAIKIPDCRSLGFSSTNTPVKDPSSTRFEC